MPLSGDASLEHHVHRFLTDRVGFSRQLNAAVLQLLHLLLQVRLLLHQASESPLELFHGAPESLVSLQGNAVCTSYVYT